MDALSALWNKWVKDYLSYKSYLFLPVVFSRIFSLQVGVRWSGTWPVHGEAGRANQEPRQRDREDV